MVLPGLYDNTAVDMSDGLYERKLRASLRGAIQFARRRQEKRRNDGKQSVAVDITFEQIWRIIQRQGYVCALTRLAFYSCGSGSFGPTRPSIDRIDHIGPYSEGNVRIVMLGVNGLRGAGNDDDMYLLAYALVENWPDPAGSAK